MSKIKILVCSHKHDYVRSDEVYMPIQVGKAISKVDLGFQGDDTGDNISYKNQSFCELTALYWAWKNLNGIDIMGLAHYRRYLDTDKHFKWGCDRCVCLDKFKEINYDNSKIDKIISKYDIIISKPRYYNTNLFTNYCVCHNSDDIRTIREIIKDLSPEYLDSYDSVMYHNEKLSHYNMFITRKEIFDDYCEWVFKILFEAERRINISHYSPLQKRIFGYMGERLLNIYVHHKKLKTYKTTTIWVNEEEKDPFILAYYYRLFRSKLISLMLNINPVNYYKRIFNIGQ